MSRAMTSSLLPSLVLLLALQCNAAFAFQPTNHGNIVAHDTLKSSALYVVQERPTSDTQQRSKRENSNANNSKRHKFTEVDRLKFRVSQLKGNMVESELRATAAERRVALLQEELKVAQQSGADGANADGISTSTSTNTQGLVDAEEAAAATEAALHAQIAEMQSQLDAAEAQRNQAQMDNDALRQSVAEMASLRRRLSEAETKVEQKAQYAEATSAELERLRTEMIDTIARTKAASHKVQQELKEELATVQNDAQNVQTRLIEEKDLAVAARDREIAHYRKERESVRKLAKRLAVAAGRKIVKPFRRS